MGVGQDGQHGQLVAKPVKPVLRAERGLAPSQLLPTVVCPARVKPSKRENVTHSPVDLQVAWD